MRVLPSSLITHSRCQADGAYAELIAQILRRDVPLLPARAGDAKQRLARKACNITLTSRQHHVGITSKLRQHHIDIVLIP